MTTITQLPTQPLRGPAQLLHWLRRLPRPLAPALTAVELDRNRLVRRACQIPVDLAAEPGWPAPAAHKFLIGVVELPNDDLHDAAIHYLQRLNAVADTQTLDVLLLVADRWWSAICTDQSCCPANGRLLRGYSADAQPGWDVWQSALTAADATFNSQLLTALSDVDVRDALLVRLLEPTAREWWQAARPTLDQLVAECDSPTAAAAYHCLVAALAYLDGDRPAAMAAVSAAREVQPDYSFARLLQHALDAAAPPELLRCAIRNSATESRLLADCA